MIQYDSQGRMSKKDAEYTDKSKSPAEHRCGICEFITKCPSTGEHHCTKVIGDINPMGGCRLFSVDLVVAANDPITLATNPPEK